MRTLDCRASREPTYPDGLDGRVSRNRSTRLAGRALDGRGSLEPFLPDSPRRDLDGRIFAETTRLAGLRDLDGRVSGIYPTLPHHTPRGRGRGQALDGRLSGTVPTGLAFSELEAGRKASLRR